MNKGKILSLVFIILVIVGGYLLFTMMPTIIAGAFSMVNLILLVIIIGVVIFGLIKAFQKLLR